MARKPFKIVNDLDLSGNRLIDVVEVYRGDYDNPLLRNLLIRAGNDAAGGTAANGGDLTLRTGTGTVAGALSLFIGDGVSKYGLEVLGTTVTTLKTNNQPISIATGTSYTEITSTVGTTSAITGALRVGGGVGIGENLWVAGTAVNVPLARTINLATAVASVGGVINIGTVTNTTTNILGVLQIASTTLTTTAARLNYLTSISGTTGTNTTNVVLSTSPTISTSIVAGTASFDLLNTVATTVNAFGAATTLAMAIATAATTINIGTGATLNAVTKTLNLGTAGVSGSTTNVNIGSAVAGALGTTTINSVNVTMTGDLAVNGGDLSSTATTFNMLVANVTTASLLDAATTITLGKTPSTTTAQAFSYGNTLNTVSTFTINPSTDSTSTASGALQVKGGVGIAKKLYVGDIAYFNGTAINTANASFDVFNTTAATLNAFGAATALTIGAATGTATIRNISISLPNATSIATNGASPSITTTSTGTASVFNTAALTGNIFGAATTINIGTGVSGAVTQPISIGGATTLGVTTFNSTLEATDASTASVKMLGGLAVAKDAYVGNDLYILGDLKITGSFSFAGTGTSEIGGTSSTIIFGAAATTVYIGKGGDLTTVVTLQGEMDATSPTVAGTILDGGLGVAKAAWIGGLLNVAGITTLQGAVTMNSSLSVLGNTTLGNANTDTSTLRGMVTLSDSSATYPLRLGADVNLYRSTADELTIADNVVIGGASLTGPATFNLANAVSTTLNMLATANSTMNVGATGAATRTMNIFAAMNIGEAANTRVVNHYGQFNFGGPTGFALQWNTTDSTLDFVKL